MTVFIPFSNLSLLGVHHLFGVQTYQNHTPLRTLLWRQMLRHHSLSTSSHLDTSLSYWAFQRGANWRTGFREAMAHDGDTVPQTALRVSFYPHKSRCNGVYDLSISFGSLVPLVFLAVLFSQRGCSLAAPDYGLTNNTREVFHELERKSKESAEYIRLGKCPKVPSFFDFFCFLRVCLVMTTKEFFFSSLSFSFA